MNLYLNSGAQGPLPYHSWYLHVRLLCRVNFPLSRRPILASSWEYLTTLDYEINIIRGRRPYRWTIVVSILHAVFVLSSPP
jgi:hypothetical protein